MTMRKTTAARKAELLMRAHQQRAELANELQDLRKIATPTGITASVLDAVNKHKLLVLGSALALTVIKPRRVLAGVEAGLIGMEVWRKAVPLYARVREYFRKV